MQQDACTPASVGRIAISNSEKRSVIKSALSTPEVAKSTKKATPALPTPSKSEKNATTAPATPALPTPAKSEKNGTPAPHTDAKSAKKATHAFPTPAKSERNDTPALPTPAKSVKKATPAPPTPAKSEIRATLAPTPVLPTPAKSAKKATPAPPTPAKSEKSATPAPTPSLPTPAKSAKKATPALPAPALTTAEEAAQSVQEAALVLHMRANSAKKQTASLPTPEVAKSVRKQAAALPTPAKSSAMPTPAKCAEKTTPGLPTPDYVKKPSPAVATPAASVHEMATAPMEETKDNKQVEESVAVFPKESTPSQTSWKEVDVKPCEPTPEVSTKVDVEHSLSQTAPTSDEGEGEVTFISPVKPALVEGERATPRLLRSQKKVPHPCKEGEGDLSAGNVTHGKITPSIQQKEPTPAHVDGRKEVAVPAVLLSLNEGEECGEVSVNDGGDEAGECVPVDLSSLSDEEVSALKVVELREVLRSMNQPLAGKKAELIERVLACRASVERAEEDGVTASRSRASKRSSTTTSCTKEVRGRL
ncbi:MAG: hypothetical protein SGPRY_002097 [Prymnesium sp.]